jgi:hypothetical protein
MTMKIHVPSKQGIAWSDKGAKSQNPLKLKSSGSIPDDATKP